MTCLVSSSTFNVTIQPFLLTSQSYKGKKYKFIVNFIKGDVILFIPERLKELKKAYTHQELLLATGCTITLTAEKMQFEISYLVYMFWFN